MSPASTWPNPQFQHRAPAVWEKVRDEERGRNSTKGNSYAQHIPRKEFPSLENKMGSELGTCLCSQPIRMAQLCLCLHPVRMAQLGTCLCSHPIRMAQLGTCLCLHPIRMVQLCLCSHPIRTAKLGTYLCLHPIRMAQLGTSLCSHPIGNGLLLLTGVQFFVQIRLSILLQCGERPYFPLPLCGKTDPLFYN